MDIGSVEHRALVADVTNFTNGEALNQAEVYFTDSRTISPSGIEELSLVGSGLSDAFGNDLAFTSIKLMLITASADNTNNVIIGNAMDALATWLNDDADRVIVVPGCTLAIIAPTAAGYTVNPGSSDLRVANSAGGTSVTYEITLIGTKA